MSRKIVFLDIDGVLQPLNSEERFKNIVHGDRRSACRPELYEYLERNFNIDYRQYHPYDVAAVYYDWDKTSVALLKVVLEYANAKIVLSSDWRIGGFDRMKDFFAIYGLDKYYIDVTRFHNDLNENFIEKVKTEIKAKKDDNLGDTYRSAEILDWLNRNPDVKKWVALDDKKLAGLGKNFVWTESKISDPRINEEHAVMCLKILK